ncbi:MAG: NAD-dependent epimerase/dehydratase family protein, partial [Nitratireductor sp.]
MSMRVLVTGAAGMIGRKLVARLVRDGGLNGRRLAALDLHDIVGADAPAIAGTAVSIHVGDLAAPGEADRLVAAKPDVVFHL